MARGAAEVGAMVCVHMPGWGMAGVLGLWSPLPAPCWCLWEPHSSEPLLPAWDQMGGNEKGKLRP